MDYFKVFFLIKFIYVSQHVSDFIKSLLRNVIQQMPIPQSASYNTLTNNVNN